MVVDGGNIVDVILKNVASGESHTQYASYELSPIALKVGTNRYQFNPNRNQGRHDLEQRVRSPESAKFVKSRLSLSAATSSMEASTLL